MPKDRRQQGKEGFAARIRTTWLPFTERPNALTDRFVSEIVDAYVKKHTMNDDAVIHVKVVRLDVEATKP